MTKFMKAVVLTRFGGPDAFELREVPVPPTGPRQVRVRVHATALNPLDYQIRRGDYKDYVPLPAIIGHDISGVVEEVGSEVDEFAAGDEVYYTPKIFGGAGSYAEHHVADVELVSRKPRNLTHLEAASLTLVGGTVWEAFVQRARLSVGETILIHGGAGGVGTIAVQVAKAIGARVITTARARDHDFVRSLGADDVIDFTTEDYVDGVSRLTGAQGVDVVFDTIGGDTLTRSPLTLAAFGRVVSLVDIAQPQNLVAAWGKNAAYHFVFTRQNRGKLDALTRLVERGLVKPVIGATLPLERVAEAHDLLENGSARGLRGKVAIEVTSEALALPPSSGPPDASRGPATLRPGRPTPSIREKSHGDRTRAPSPRTGLGPRLRSRLRPGRFRNRSSGNENAPINMRRRTMTGRLTNKVAVVTGGTTGIGLAVARRFASEGASVFVTGRRQAELDAAIASIGHGAVGVRADMSVLADIDRLYDAVQQKHGQIDVVMANAAGGDFAPLGAITEEQYERTFGTNVKGTIFTVQKALPLLKDGASVILTGSTTSIKGTPAFSIYSATKAAVRNLARSWMLDLKDRGIRVNVVSLRRGPPCEADLGR